jgi:hypothetical protein
MTSAQAFLTLQLLEWVAEKPRSHPELMEVWKSNCPQLSIWEDACADGLLGCGAGRNESVFLSEKGQHCLRTGAVNS